MNIWGEPTDYGKLLAGNSSRGKEYANTEKAETLMNGGNYQDNSNKIKRPHNRPGSSFITIPRPKSAIPGRS